MKSPKIASDFSAGNAGKDAKLPVEKSNKERLDPKLLPPEVEAALHIWLSGANIDNKWKPLSDEKTAKRVSDLLGKSPPYGKTTIFRWRNKYGFAAHLETLVAQTIANDKAERANIQKSANRAIVENAIDDFQKNRAIMGSCYEAMEIYAKEVADDLAGKKAVSMDRMRLVVEIFKATSTREDKMYDRQALTDAANRLSKDEVMAKLLETTIDYE